MASIAMMAGGALVNALAFSGTNFLFHKLSAGDAERKRHDLAMEQFTRDHNTWLKSRQNKIDQERKRRLAAQTAEKTHARARSKHGRVCTSYRCARS